LALDELASAPESTSEAAQPVSAMLHESRDEDGAVKHEGKVARKRLNLQMIVEQIEAQLSSTSEPLDNVSFGAFSDADDDDDDEVAQDFNEPHGLPTDDDCCVADLRHAGTGSGAALVLCRAAAGASEAEPHLELGARKDYARRRAGDRGHVRRGLGDGHDGTARLDGARAGQNVGGSRGAGLHAGVSCGNAGDAGFTGLVLSVVAKRVRTSLARAFLVIPTATVAIHFEGGVDGFVSKAREVASVSTLIEP